MDEISNGDALLNKKPNILPTIILYVFIVIELVIFTLINFYYVTITDGQSMMNTLQDKQLFIVQRLAYSIDRGDLITINVAKKDEKNYILIKRVVGIGGDKLIFMIDKDNTHVDLYRMTPESTHFERLDEEYIGPKMNIYAQYHKTPVMKYNRYLEEIDFSEGASNPDISKNQIKTIEENIIEVPNNSVYFLGDNRNDSQDSRYYGAEPLDKIIGKVVKIVDPESIFDKFLRFIYLLPQMN